MAIILSVPETILIFWTVDNYSIEVDYIEKREALKFYLYAFTLITSDLNQVISMLFAIKYDLTAKLLPIIL